MPKIIENVRQQLLDEVGKQISERGYANVTIRSIASSLGLGTGTVYNYFKSKDMLVASYVAENWHDYMNHFKSLTFNNSKEALKQIYDMLIEFNESQSDLFTDPDAIKRFSSISGKNHPLLRQQIANLILPLCENQDNPEFLSSFIAESLLTWTTAKNPFEELYPILSKLIDE